ncbi:MAG: ABC transporter permease [Promethearchaeota archaeon]
MSWYLSDISGDPIAAYLGSNSDWGMSPEQREAVRKRVGADKPWYIRYVKYSLRMLRGDWGESPNHRGTNVLELLAKTFPASAELGAIAMIFALCVGIPLGIIAAIKKNQKSDHIVRVGTLVGCSLPVFVLGLILQTIYYHTSSRLTSYFNRQEIAYFFPRSHRFSPVVTNPPDSILLGLLRPTGILFIDSLLSFDLHLFVDCVIHLIAPVTVLGVSLIAIIARMTRLAMIEVLNSDYILLAKSKGLSERVIIYRHALKNALFPVLTVGGIILANLLTGAIYVEIIFNWPGMGKLVSEGVANLDMPIIHGFCILAALIYATSNLVVDLVYAWLDPRVQI